MTVVTGTDRHGLTESRLADETAGQDREEKQERPLSSLRSLLSTLSEQTEVQLRPSGVPGVGSVQSVLAH